MRQFNIEVDFKNAEAGMGSTKLKVIHTTDDMKANTTDILETLKAMLGVVITEARNGFTHAIIISEEK
jgi:hypothetical protein